MLTANTVVLHPETGAITVLLAGQDVPDWAESLVGDHLLDNGGHSSHSPLGSGGRYASMTVADLKAEIGKRNADREDDAQLAVDGKKADLVAVLEADDEPATEPATEPA